MAYSDFFFFYIKDPMAYPLILIETPLVVHVCIFKCISVFVFQFLNMMLNLGCLKVLLWVTLA